MNGVICSRCGKHVRMVMSISMMDHKPTESLCQKCWNLALKDLPSRVRFCNKQKLEDLE